MLGEKELLIVRWRQEFDSQPLLFLDETILTAGIDHTVTERKLGNLKNTSSSSLKKEDNACVIGPDAFQNCKESASETHLPAEKNFLEDGAGSRGSGLILSVENRQDKMAYREPRRIHYDDSTQLDQIIYGLVSR
jgi:hypothetical protein